MKESEMENILKSEGRERGRDVFVRHDVTVVGGEA